jgi:hypothetical protein
MQHFVEWGNTKDSWPVVIERAGSANELLDPVYLGTLWKSSDLKVLGVMVDADNSIQSRWDCIRNFCKTADLKNIPKAIPREGLVLACDDGRKFGAWIMPDNESEGMLETLCCALIPAPSQPLWAHAVAAASRAKELGASFIEAHRQRADIHTWLAWQDPPGERIGIALTSKKLNVESEAAKPFVDWFVRLYELQRTERAPLVG